MFPNLFDPPHPSLSSQTPPGAGTLKVQPGSLRHKDPLLGTPSTYQAIPTKRPLGQASYQPSPSPQGFTARLPFWDNAAIADISLFCGTRPLGLLIERWNRRRVSCPEGLPSIEIAINTLSGDRLEGAAGYFVPSMFFAVGGPSRIAAPNSRSVGGAPNQRTNDDYLATITLNASINMETN